MTDPTRNPGNRTISWSNGPVPLTLSSGFAGTQDNTPVEYVLDAGNNLDGYVGPHPVSGVVVQASFGIGTAGNVETGFDPVTMLRWGRWSGGTADITLFDGTDASEDLSQKSLHWISSPEWMTPPVIPLSGAVDYSLIGNTAPTNNFGDVGVLGSATFLADFTNMMVFNTLNLDIGGSNWIASGSGNIGVGAGLPAHQFSGFYNNVTVDGFSTDFGYFGGFFSEPGNTPDPNFPGGAGLTYTLFDDLAQKHIGLSAEILLRAFCRPVLEKYRALTQGDDDYQGTVDAVLADELTTLWREASLPSNSPLVAGSEVTNANLT